MVNLSAAGLGVSTSNTNQALAEGLQGLTQGLVQGMKLKFLKQQQDREQAQFEQEQNQTKAAQRGLSLLAGESAWQPPDNSAQVADAQGQISEAGKALTDSGALAGTPFAMAGDLISRGAMSSSKPLGQALDWENLKKHQAEFAQFMRKEIANSDPVRGAALLQGMKQGFVEDAMLLHRSHAVSQAHDDIVGGAFDTFTPDGQVIRDPEITKKVSDLATQVEQGAMSPEQYEATVAPLREQAHASYVENKQRFYRAQSADKDLQAFAAQGKTPPDSAVAAQHQLAVGRYDPKQFAEDWPHLLEGKVKYKGDWEFPETIAKLKQRDDALAAATEELARARAVSERADAAAKGPFARFQANLYSMMQTAAKRGDEKAKAWTDSFDKAMAQPGRTTDEAAKIATQATGYAGPGAGAAPATGNKGNPADVNAAGASIQGFADSLKGRKRADVVSTLGQLRAAGKITDEQGKAIISAMGGLPAPDPIDLNAPNSKSPVAPSLMGGPSPKLKAATAEIEADRRSLDDAEQLPPDQAREVERKIMEKYGLNRGELYAFRKGTLRPQSGVLK